MTDPETETQAEIVEAVAEPKIEPEVQHPEGVSEGGPVPFATEVGLTAQEFATGLGPKTKSAGFLHWAKTQDPPRRTAQEWATAHAEFLQKPVR